MALPPSETHTHTTSSGLAPDGAPSIFLGFSVLRFGSTKLLVPMIIGCPPLERGGVPFHVSESEAAGEHALPAVAEARRDIFFYTAVLGEEAVDCSPRKCGQSGIIKWTRSVLLYSRDDKLRAEIPCVFAVSSGIPAARAWILLFRSA